MDSLHTRISLRTSVYMIKSLNLIRAQGICDEFIDNKCPFFQIQEPNVKSFFNADSTSGFSLGQ